MPETPESSAAPPPSNVVPFRSTRALEGLFTGDQSDPATCACGEGWFVLVGQEIAPNGAVTVTREGRITGYHGELRCLSCGSPAALGR